MKKVLITKSLFFNQIENVENEMSSKPLNLIEFKKKLFNTSYKNKANINEINRLSTVHLAFWNKHYLSAVSFCS
jgi:hypothetical protein